VSKGESKLAYMSLCTNSFITIFYSHSCHVQNV